MAEKLATADRLKTVREYISNAKLKTELERTGLQKDKTGVFTGSYAVNPANGEALPVWISDFVLITYGTGAIMSVPAHDSRDWEFARKFNLPIREVIKSPHDVQEAVMEDKGSTCVNSSNSDISLDGLDFSTAFNAMADWLESKGHGKRKINYKLRDWIFSRQRYWGEPIPVKHYEDGSLRPETDLPLTLPDVEAYQPSTTGESPWQTSGSGCMEKTTTANSAVKPTPCHNGLAAAGTTCGLSILRMQKRLSIRRKKRTG